MAQRTPVEDVMLAVLREKLPDIGINTLISKSQTLPFVLVRRGNILGDDTGDPRFIDRASVIVECFCVDPNGDDDASILSEAVRVALIEAGRERKVYAGLGHIVAVTMTSSPRRAPDWATSTGPVQYADLPTGFWRYETQYTVAVRKPSTNPYPTP